MNCHLSMQISDVGQMLFLEMAPHYIEECKSITEKRLKDKKSVAFWQNVSMFFKQNDVTKKTHSTEAPCFYVKDSSSVGRHRQHLYIHDKEKNLFQIYTITHRATLSLNDNLPLAAIAQGLIDLDVSGVDKWFDDYRLYALKQLKSAISCVIKDYEHYSSNERFITEISEKFLNNLFRHTHYEYRPNFNFEDYQFKGLPDLSNLFKMYKSSYKSNIPLSDFKHELDRILDELS